MSCYFFQAHADGQAEVSVVAAAATTTRTCNTMTSMLDIKPGQTEQPLLHGYQNREERRRRPKGIHSRTMMVYKAVAKRERSLTFRGFLLHRFVQERKEGGREKEGGQRRSEKRGVADRRPKWKKETGALATSCTIASICCM